jgi:hypothetical protein
MVNCKINISLRLSTSKILSIGDNFYAQTTVAANFLLARGREIYHTPPRRRGSSIISTHNVSAMSLSCHYAARSCVRSLRSPTTLRISTASLAQRRNPSPARRWASTEAATNPKVSGIVDQISQLTLLETADLVASLKVCLLGALCWFWRVEKKLRC